MKGLQGKNILVTRGESQASPFIDMIQEEGGVCYHTPLLTFQLNESESHQKILHQLHDFSWVFLTSSNGVKFFFKLMEKYESEIPEKMKFAIIGSKTESMLSTFGYEADFLPSNFQATNMGEEFFLHYPAPGKILYIRGNRSRDVLPDLFRTKGVFFQSMTVYDTLLVKAQKNEIKAWLVNRKLDALTFTSPSTVQAFLSMVNGTEIKGLELPCFCIGPTTAEIAKTNGFEEVLVPERYTINHMVRQMVHYFS